MQVATIENQMHKVLRAEGLTELEFVAIMETGVEWNDPYRALSFEDATYPIMLDTVGVFYMYGADTYDVFLVDKKGRLVTKMPFSEAMVLDLNKRLRKLHAE